MLRFQARQGKPFQFVFVYITEAHASDTWPMKWSVEWPKPTSMEQRLQYAKTCATELKLEPAFSVLVDEMDDSFNNAFCSWPTCYYVVDSSARLLYIGDSNENAMNALPGEKQAYASFDVKLLFRFLRSLL